MNRKSIHRIIAAAAGIGLRAAALDEPPTLLAIPSQPAVGNVIFIHPDGAGIAHWTAARLMLVGPDGLLEWDRLPFVAVYRGHMKDALAATSHGGATTHAFGRKVPADSFGMDGKTPLTALSGRPASVMREALNAGLAVGIVNSGAIEEPGTAVFLTSSKSRKNGEEIAAGVIESGAQVILGGGERWMLPEGTAGRHGPGTRRDGRNLIKEAREKGYAIVYDREELAALPPDTTRVLGVFAHHHTFHDLPEEELRRQQLPLYVPSAPTVGEMTAAALAILARQGKRFLLVVEEEGTDNFGNANNAAGVLEALRRADSAFAAARAFLRDHPNTLILTAADSDAGGLHLVAVPAEAAEKPLPPTRRNGAPLDGRDGTGTPPFLAMPDRFGQRLPFGIAWADLEDVAGGIVVRADGLNAQALRSGACDNTDIYRLIYLTLFGHVPGSDR